MKINAESKKHYVNVRLSEVEICLQRNSFEMKIFIEKFRHFFSLTARYSSLKI